MREDFTRADVFNMVVFDLVPIEWNQFNVDLINSCLSKREVLFSFSKHLFKRNILLAKDTKHIQEKETLNGKCRSFVVFFCVCVWGGL